MTLQQLFLKLKGSSTSGNYGHAGRPGSVGGSGQSGSSFSIISTTQEVKDRVKKIIDWENITREELENIFYSGPSKTDGYMTEITKKLGLNGLPKQVDLLSNDATVLQRNFVDEKRFDEFLHDTDMTFVDGSYHNFGTGIYAANELKGEHNDFGVIQVKMGLPKSAKVIEWDALSQIKSRISKDIELDIDSGNKQGYRLDSIVSDSGRLAAILGYDAIKIPGQSERGWENEYVVVNRGILEVEKR